MPKFQAIVVDASLQQEMHLVVCCKVQACVPAAGATIKERPACGGCPSIAAAVCELAGEWSVILTER